MKERESWHDEIEARKSSGMGIKEVEKQSSIIPATAEAIAHIATEKFVQGTPLYRQEQQRERNSITLSRQTMSNCLLKAVAVQYALNQEGYLMNAFLDGRLELTNNLAERSIKPFVIGRKNFLFANRRSICLSNNPCTD